MAKPLTTYEDVLAALRRLPGPEKGLVRVYRGQTQDHKTPTPDGKSTMRPSGLRRTIQTYGVWRPYAMGLAEDLRRQADRGRAPPIPPIFASSPKPILYVQL